jgi:hypothetical protein
MDALELLRSLNEEVPHAPQLSTHDDVRNAEEKLGVAFPPSYVKYQLQYSDVTFGTYEPYHLFQDGSYLDLVASVDEARENGLPDHLLPFVEDNSDYFCFDLQSAGPEYKVAFWSHNGKQGETWSNFLDWVERCWIGEEY